MPDTFGADPFQIEAVVTLQPLAQLPDAIGLCAYIHDDIYIIRGSRRVRVVLGCKKPDQLAAH
jgi:hypothetical protein